jgi:Na+/melibiose symporter-like transporter
MALLPSISINKKNRDYMVRLRTGFTFLSQMICLFLSFFIFYYIQDKYTQYSILSLCCVFIGLFTSIFFILYCNETIFTKNIDIYYNNLKIALNKYYKNNLEEQGVVKNLSLDSADKTQFKQNAVNNNETQSFNYNTIENKEETEEMIIKDNNEYGVKYWLSKPAFYKNIIVYMLVRLSINVTTSMMPYYLEYILLIKKTEYGGTPILTITYIERCK